MTYPDERTPDRPTILARALARRERHRRRPLAVRAIPFAAVAAVVAASALVVVRLGFWPPFALPAVVALLSLEFVWAARLLAWFLGRLARFVRRVRTRSLRLAD